MSQWQIQVTIFLSGTDVTLSEYFEESNYKKKWELFLLTKQMKDEMEMEIRNSL